MKAFWSYTKLFTPEECNWIVETAKLDSPSWAKTGVSVSDPNLEKTFEHRRSKIIWIMRDHPKLGFLHKSFWEVVTEMNNELYGAHISDLPPLQFTQYSEQYQGEYKLHMDVDWLATSNATSKIENQRKVSAVLQLSDPNDYEGGEFEFGPEVREKPPADYLRQQGVLFSFPSFLHHGVRPVTKGKRYSLVGWFEGPAWR
jgi:PKHD-type hydroxylase